MRLLTKSRFKIALECPTKLYYTGKMEYPDKKLDNAFLEALAKGGFQVGELAKCYFPGGTNIEELDYKTALERTNELLKQNEAIIYEAAFQYKNLFIRADIVVKKGNRLLVYEVKAKSINPTEDELLSSKGTIVSQWKPYLYDIAFQKYVIENAYPQFSIEAYLTLADKSKVASVSGLNQKFFLFKDERERTKVKIVGETSKIALGQEVLVNILVDDIIHKIFDEEYFTENPEKSFIEWIHFYADEYENDKPIFGTLGSKCSKCEFKATQEEINIGKISGYKECWKKSAKFKESDFDKPHINEIWDFRKKDSYISQGKFFQSDLSRSDLEAKNAKSSNKSGLTRVDRQELQIERSRNKDLSAYIDKGGIKKEMESWKFPLHFIDFETTAVAIPFTEGRHPYEQTVFQYSHHQFNADRKIEHKGQWINSKQGVFPNFDFIRALKSELDKDDGTIFRYAAHENSMLNAIYRQLSSSKESDKNELMEWIKTITHSTSSSAEKWQGKRDMVDMLEIIKSYYYHPETKGSNSIKEVLPALLNSSTFLKNKYSEPIYGTNQILSLNFENHIWINLTSDQKVINPYKKLKPIFEGIDQELLDNLVLDDDADLQDGGSAMIAYAQMQFTEMSLKERELIEKALLRYCELDTFAMVMIYEELYSQIN